MPNCTVLTVDDSIVAFSVFWENILHFILVDEYEHKKGYGKKLLQYSESQLFSKGNESIQLETFEGNKNAINFYQNNGWLVIKRQKDNGER